LTGFVGRERDIDSIAQALQAQGADVSMDLDTRPWPQCEVLVNLREALAQPRGLKVSVAGQADAALKSRRQHHDRGHHAEQPAIST
jgi:hypothetical protein